uniref:Uncharacterized protein n=1 Tax=Nelumbo nucifera TaxID=4432 RepID=A0A822ZF06_NELNU|nr:TPA_asm: hypothetical protein HUJ06_001697 [Nelumbo nucifera]
MMLEKIKSSKVLVFIVFGYSVFFFYIRYDLLYIPSSCSAPIRYDCFLMTKSSELFRMSFVVFMLPMPNICDSVSLSSLDQLNLLQIHGL